MEINERRVGQVVIYTLTAREGERGSFAGFQQLIRDHLAAGDRSFVVNLSSCPWVDSQGLGELVRSLVAVMRQGGNLKLAETPHRLRGILAVTNLTQVFDLFESEQAAIDSFRV